MRISNLIQKITLPYLLLAASCCVQGSLSGSSSAFSEQKCLPCQGGVPPLKGDDLIALQQHLQDEWEIIDEHHLERKFDFDDFASALAFTNVIGELAEVNGHHPKIILSYGRVKIRLWTHKSDGLTESDFILAAKIDALQSSGPGSEAILASLDGI